MGDKALSFSGAKDGPTVINLSYNQLQFLNFTTVDELLDELKTELSIKFDLDNNPIQCTREMVWVPQMKKKHGNRFTIKGTCSDPTKPNGRLLEGKKVKCIISAFLLLQDMPYFRHSLPNYVLRTGRHTLGDVLQIRWKFLESLSEVLIFIKSFPFNFQKLNTFLKQSAYQSKRYHQILLVDPTFFTRHVF